ncbi:phospholipase A(1) LCAT3-like protein [Tanacetum coccineum]
MQDTFALGDKPHSFFAPEGKPSRFYYTDMGKQDYMSVNFENGLSLTYFTTLLHGHFSDTLYIYGMHTHFHDSIDMLVDCGYKKGTTLFGYGYDFRQSNRIDQAMNGLKERLETAYEAAGGRKVNLISHSMGGLLVSCFISLHSDVFSKYVKKWITIASPFQGAPGCINDSLLTGLQFVEGLESYFFVSRWSMHQLLVECPSIYEMLPNPEFNWKKQPEIMVWRNRSENGQDTVKMERYGTSGCVGLFVEALKDNEIEYNKKTIPLPFNYDIYQWAATTRKMLNSVRLPEGIPFYNIYGTSLETPFDVCYGSETDPIDDATDICHTLPEYTFVDGDGTVPAESAMSEYESRSHTAALLRDETVFDYIRKWLGIEELGRRSRVKTSKVVDVGLA